MGAEPYWYCIAYQTDTNTTLQALRQREFAAGRYNPVVPFIDFPITDSSPTPGAQHSSIEEALEASEADGTRSILDISQVSTVPYSVALLTQDWVDLACTTFPLSGDELMRFFGTDKPTHEIVSVIISREQNKEAADELWQSIERGTAKHIFIYDGDIIREIFFIGLSFD